MALIAADQKNSFAEYPNPFHTLVTTNITTNG